MRTGGLIACLAVAAAIACGGCASSAAVDSRRVVIEEQIQAILAEPQDPAVVGLTKRCLADYEYRNFQVLDDRRILFEGRRDRYWINTLRMRCPDLRHAHVLQVKSFSYSRVCDADQFIAADWFYWPWYRRWPWHWRSAWGAGPACVLGKFQPVSEQQATAIKEVVRSR